MPELYLKENLKYTYSSSALGKAKSSFSIILDFIYSLAISPDLYSSNLIVKFPNFSEPLYRLDVYSFLADIGCCLVPISVTVTLHEYLKFPILAYIIDAPAFLGKRTPFETVTTVGVDDDQRTFCLVLFNLSVYVSSKRIDKDFTFKVGFSTLTTHFNTLRFLFCFSVAVMVHLPFFFATITPFLTEAILVLLLFHFTFVFFTFLTLIFCFCEMINVTFFFDSLTLLDAFTCIGTSRRNANNSKQGTIYTFFLIFI